MVLRAAAADGGVGALMVRAGRGTRLSFFVAAAADRGRESGAVRAAGVSRLAVEVGDGASPEKWPSRRVSGLQVPFVAGKATAQALAGWQAEGDSWASRSTELHTARARSLCLSPLSRSSSSLLDPVARSQALAALRALRCDQHACRSSTGIQSTTKPPPGPSSRSAHLPQAPP